MPSETPKLDELLKDSPYFTTFSREMFAAARAELAALREQLKQARNAALDEAADECYRRKESQVYDGEYVAACQLRDAAKAILALKGS